MATKRHTRYSGLKHLIYIPIVALSILLFSFVPGPAFLYDNQVILQANTQNTEYSTNIPSINPIRSEDLIRHGESLHSFYGHLDEVLVKEGQKVSRGCIGPKRKLFVFINIPYTSFLRVR